MKTAVWNPAACSDLDVCKVSHVPGPVHAQGVPMWISSQLYSDPLLNFPLKHGKIPVIKSMKDPCENAEFSSFLDLLIHSFLK